MLSKDVANVLVQLIQKWTPQSEAESLIQAKCYREVAEASEPVADPAPAPEGEDAVSDA